LGAAVCAGAIRATMGVIRRPEPLGKAGGQPAAFPAKCHAGGARVSRAKTALIPIRFL